MRTLYYFLIGILLFYIDTAIGLLIPMNIGKFELVFVPHLTFMYILMMVVYRGFGVSLLLSIFLGVMTDVYFGSIYGVYLFGYILFLALIDRFFKIFYKDHSMLFIIILASTLLLEVYVALIYGMLGFIQFDIIHFDIIHFVVFRLLPTLIMNFVLLIMLYPLIIKFLKKTNNDIDMKRRQW
ncbi:TPA: rod shape-determining protein MreD [Staphylococcus aureus]|nr:rod shape-determining protein MreD [Staphylococcus aureus]